MKKHVLSIIVLYTIRLKEEVYLVLNLVRGKGVKPLEQLRRSLAPYPLFVGVVRVGGIDDISVVGFEHLVEFILTDLICVFFAHLYFSAGSWVHVVAKLLDIVELQF